MHVGASLSVPKGGDLPEDSGGEKKLTARERKEQQRLERKQASKEKRQKERREKAAERRRQKSGGGESSSAAEKEPLSSPPDDKVVREKDADSSVRPKRYSDKRREEKLKREGKAATGRPDDVDGISEEVSKLTVKGRKSDEAASVEERELTEEEKKRKEEIRATRDTERQERKERLKNKVRPEAQVYRPGMGRFSGTKNKAGTDAADDAAGGEKEKSPPEQKTGEDGPGDDPFAGFRRGSAPRGGGRGGGGRGGYLQSKGARAKKASQETDP